MKKIGWLNWERIQALFRVYITIQKWRLCVGVKGGFEEGDKINNKKEILTTEGYKKVIGKLVLN